MRTPFTIVGRIARRLGLVAEPAPGPAVAERNTSPSSGLLTGPLQTDSGSFDAQHPTQPMAVVLGPVAGVAVPPVHYDPADTILAVVRIVDGAESKGVGTAIGHGSEGAVFSDRGIGYARHNEDAAILGVEKGEPFAAVADQAGGEGHLHERVGFASALAALSVEQAAREIGSGANPRKALESAVVRAHREIRQVNEAAEINAVTTLTGAVVRGRTAYVVNVGDSQVLHLSATGEVKNATIAHSMAEENYASHPEDPLSATRNANVITRSLGAARKDKPDVSEWPLAPGDSLVLVSDGLLDANLRGQLHAHAAGRDWTEPHTEVTRREICKIVGAAKSSPEAVKALIEYARRQVLDGKGKPDNVSAAVIRIRDAQA